MRKGRCCHHCRRRHHLQQRIQHQSNEYLESRIRGELVNLKLKKLKHEQGKQEGRRGLGVNENYQQGWIPRLNRLESRGNNYVLIYPSRLET